MKALVAIFMGLSLMACSVRQVPAGHVGVKVYLLGKSKGVDSETVGVGWQSLGFNEQLYLFPTFKQNYVWTKSPHEGRKEDESITFQTREGLEVNADIGITYEVIPDKVSILFAKYRKGIEEITDVYIRNYVRDAMNEEASRMDVESVYGEGKIALLQAAEDRVRKQVEPEGIKIEKIYLVGQFRLPETVMEALNAKITATQKAQQRENEVAQAKAQANIEIAKANGDAQALLMNAKAEAEANRLRSQTISESLIKLEMAKRWNGELPTVMGSGAFPMFDLKSFNK